MFCISSYKHSFLRRGLSANISLTFQATLNLYVYDNNHCFAVLCKFLGILEKIYFFSKDRLNCGKYENVEDLMDLEN